MRRFALGLARDTSESLTIFPFLPRILVALTGANNAGGKSMRDILRDWRRWSRAERVIALLIVTILTVGVPAVLARNVSVASHHPGLTRSL